MAFRAGVGLATLVLASQLFTPGFAGATSPGHGYAGQDCDQRCQEELARARAATEKYRDAVVALTDGFVETGGCQGGGEGTFGIAYSHVTRGLDQHVGVEQPEALVYMPEGLNGRRLAAVEYSVPVVEDGQEPPELFGRRFDGPVAAGLGRRYRLRVWLYAYNSRGLFTAANPTEACTSDQLVDWHGKTQDCLEVTGTITVPAERVREVGDVPPAYELAAGVQPGTAQVNIGTHQCQRAETADGTVVAPLRFAHYTALLEPPDHSGQELLSLGSRYLLRLILDDRKVATLLRQGMGVPDHAITFSPDLERDFDPIVGATAPHYRYDTPDFLLEATVIEPAPAAGPATTRMFRDTPQGTGTLYIWLDLRELGAADVTVTPRPGSLLAELVGCEALAADCDPVTADHGLVVGFHGTSVRAFNSGDLRGDSGRLLTPPPGRQPPPAGAGPSATTPVETDVASLSAPTTPATGGGQAPVALGAVAAGLALRPRPR